MASLFRPRPRSLPQYHRLFSTTSARPVSLQLDKNSPEALSSTLPPYPYGPTKWYKQSALGLYSGQRLQFGNNVSEKFSIKSRRTWHPNVLTRKLWSNALGRTVQVRVTTRTLRTIDKVGGLDEYLLGEKEARVRGLGESGWWLRWAIMQTAPIRKRFAEERRRLGVPEEEVVGEEKEVAEAQNVVEEASEAEVDAAAETGEAVAADGAFQVQTTPGLLPLKFRVGPGKHLILTPSGWIRTRPDPNRLVTQTKQRMLQQLTEKELPGKEEEFLRQLKEQERGLEPDQRFTEEERKGVLKEARTEWRTECERRVEEEWRRGAVEKEGKVRGRRAAKKVRREKEAKRVEDEIAA